MIKLSSKNFTNFWACSNLMDKNLTFHFNLKGKELDSSQLSKLEVDFCVKLICDKIFSLKYWTNSFKTELLSVILSHSGIEFDLLFNFTQSMTKSDWSFEDFWLTCFDYYAAMRREIQIVDGTPSAKTKIFGANFSNLNTSYETISTPF